MAKRKLQTWVEFCLSNKEIRLHSCNFYNMKLDSSLSNISSRKKAQKKKTRDEESSRGSHLELSSVGKLRLQKRRVNQKVKI